MMALSNIAANSCRAAYCNGVVMKGDLGEGLLWVSTLVTSIAASADNVDGIFSLYGKKSTVQDTRSLLVFVMHV